MSQDQTKVFHGPYTATFDKTTAAGTKSYSGSNKESVEINITTKVATEEMVDGAEIYDEAGRTVEGTIGLSEIVAADLDTIEDCSTGATPGIRIQFTNMPAGTDTLSLLEQGIKFFADVVNGKPVIRFKMGVPAGTTMATLFQIG